MASAKDTKRLPKEDPLGAYLREIERRHRRAVRALEKRGGNLRWRVRLRVRMGARLGVDAESFKTKFRRRVVTIYAREKGEHIKEAEWLIFAASRFATPVQALEFGRGLQTALSALGAISRRPIDVGADNAASAKFGDDVKDALAKQGHFLFDDIHGLDILPDTPASFWLAFGAKVTVTTPPELFFDGLDMADRVGRKLDEKGVRAALLLNAASMAEHPVGRLILSVAAIELLADQGKWSVAQKQWIKDARERIRSEKSIDAQERSELEKAVEGMFRFSIRESTERLLNEIGAGDRVDEWNSLYAGRSRFVHANKHFSFEELVNLASRANDLCPEIFKEYVSSRT